MAPFVLLLLAWTGPYITAAEGFGLGDLLKESCGIWEEYTADKCIKIMADGETFSKEEADKICAAENTDYFPEAILITLRTEEEQEFLHNYLFKKQGIKVPVWLRVKQDEIGLNYSSDGQLQHNGDKSMSNDNEYCVEMSPEDQNTKLSQLDSVDCNKSNVVVCERLPSSSMMFLESLWSPVKEYIGDTIIPHLSIFEDGSNSSAEEVFLKYFTAMDELDTEENTSLSPTNFEKRTSETNINSATTPDLNAVLLRLNAAEAVIAALVRMNKNAVKELSAIKRRSDTIDEVMRSMKEENVEATKKVDALEIKYNEAEQRISAVEQSNEAAKIKIEAIEQRSAASLSSVSEAINLEISQLQQMHLKLDADLVAVKEKNGIAETKIGALEQTYEAAHKDLIFTKETSQATQVIINDMKHESEMVQKELNDFKQRDDVFDAHITALSHRNLAADADINSFKVRIETADNEIITLREENEMLEKKILAVEELHRVANEEASSLKDKCFGLDKDIGEVLQRHEVATNKTFSLEKTIGILETKTTVLKSKNAELDQRLETVSEEMNTLKHKVNLSENAAEQTKETTNAEMTTLKQWRNDLEKRLITEKQITDLSETLRDIEDDNEATKFEIEGIKKLNLEAQEKFSNVNQRYQTSEAKLVEVEQSVTQTKEDVKKLTANPVPVGFIYVQLPDQPSPTALWPTVKWENVSPKHAGLFFRVEGGDAAAFGEIQLDHTRHLSGANSTYNIAGKTIFKWADVSTSSPWSNYIYTGTSQDGRKVEGMQFSLSTGEVRPRNQAVRLWKRIK